MTDYQLVLTGGYPTWIFCWVPGSCFTTCIFFKAAVVLSKFIEIRDSHRNLRQKKYLWCLRLHLGDGWLSECVFKSCLVPAKIPSTWCLWTSWIRLAVSTFTFTLLASGVVLLTAGFIQWCEHPCCSSLSNAEIMTRPPYASWAMYCSMFPTTMDLETEYSSFLTFQPYYFPALDATMDQRSLPMGYSFLGHEPDHLVCCDVCCPDPTQFARWNNLQKVKLRPLVSRHLPAAKRPW